MQAQPNVFLVQAAQVVGPTPQVVPVQNITTSQERNAKGSIHVGIT